MAFQALGRPRTISIALGLTLIPLPPFAFNQ
jgi:hypothetical protein